MIINRLINKETFNSLMEMYKRQGMKVTNKVLDDKFISYVTEGVQHIFVDDIKDYPIGLVSNSILCEADESNITNKKPIENVNESIQIVAKDFIKHHGKSPAGVGSWIFGIGSRKSEDWFEYKGKFQDGKKKAILKAEEAEVSKVFVMENVSGEMNDVRFIVNESKKGYRVALLVEGKEISVTKAITIGGAVNIGARQVHDVLIERSLTKPEYQHREGIVHAMKSKASDFRKRYGDKAKSVMYGTATKLAKNGITESDDTDPNIGRKWKDRFGDEIEVEFMKDGKYFTLKNGKPFGGEIIPVDQLERTIKVDTSWYNKKLELDKEIADQAAAEIAAKQAKDKEYSGIKGSSKLDTGRRVKALDKKLRLSSGEILTVKQIIDREIKDGAKLEVHNFWNDRLGKSVPETVLMSPDGTFRDQKNIGKIGLEYAKDILGVSESRIRIEKDTSFSIEKSDEEPMSEPYSEEEGSTFESNGNFYDMNAILDAANSIDEVEEFDVDKLEWVLDYDKVRLDDLVAAEERLAGADKDIPILVYFDQTQPEGEEWVVVDGVHRLAKALLDDDKTIQAKILDDEAMDMAFIPQEDDNITEAKTYTQRAPYKAVKIKDIFGNVFYKVKDKSETFLSAELSKEDADILVKNLNSVSEIELHEATKTFEVKYRTVDGDNTTEGVKTITAPDSGKARTRFAEDNTELKGLQIISVNEVR